MKVLVIDDSTTLRRGLRHALASVGFDVVEASDGLEALELLRGDEVFDLALCDVNMPRLGGLELLDAAQDLERRPPFLMLTTDGQAENVRAARARGAAGWIVKPVDPDHLVKAARHLIRRGAA